MSTGFMRLGARLARSPPQALIRCNNYNSTAAEFISLLLPKPHPGGAIRAGSTPPRARTRRARQERATAADIVQCCACSSCLECPACWIISAILEAPSLVSGSRKRVRRVIECTGSQRQCAYFGLSGVAGQGHSTSAVIQAAAARARFLLPTQPPSRSIHRRCRDVAPSSINVRSANASA